MSILTDLSDTLSAVPSILTVSITLTCAPEAILESLFFSAVV